MHLIRSAAKKNSTLKGTRMLPWKLELLLSPRLTANQLAQFVWSVALLPRLHTKPRSKYSWNCSEQLHKSYSNNCGKYSVHHIDTYIIGGVLHIHFIILWGCCALLCWTMFSLHIESMEPLSPAAATSGRLRSSRRGTSNMWGGRFGHDESIAVVFVVRFSQRREATSRALSH